MWEGWQLQRSTFDDLLRARAADVGVEVLLGARALHVVREERSVVGAVLDCGERRARVVIDASGHHGWLARRLGLVSRCYSEPLFAGFGHMQAAVAADGAARSPVFRPERDGWTWRADVRSGVRAWVRVARCTQDARCVPESQVPEKQRGMLKKCATGLCVPEKILAHRGQYIPDTCSSVAGNEGRCLHI